MKEYDIEELNPRPNPYVKAMKKQVTVSTGYPELDDYLEGGFHRSDVVVLAASPCVGISAFALNIADRVSNMQNTPVIYFDLLSPKSIVLDKLVTIHTGTSMRIDPRGDLDAFYMRGTAIEDIVTRSIEIVGPNCRLLSMIRDKCMLFAGKDPYNSFQKGKDDDSNDHNAKENIGIPGLIVIDNMQNIAFDGERAITKHEFSELAKRIKKIAVETGCLILLLSILLRDVAKRRDKRPRLSDLRHFGLPKEVADKVILLYRDEVFDNNSPERNIAELTVYNKGSYDEPGLMRLRTNLDNCRFEEEGDAMPLFFQDDREEGE